jgi:exopolyphosphatase/guanosine-5'-triphosphate,3'-diphosphate pyrophosphatase
LLLIDAGGGSTQLVHGLADTPGWRASFPIGAVRLLERFRPADPPTANDWERCRSCLASAFGTTVRSALPAGLLSSSSSAPCLVATGGSATILARMALEANRFDRAQIERLSLSREAIAHTRERLWRATLAERRNIQGLPPNRADLILMGAAIIESFLMTFGFDRLKVSTRGLRFAAVAELASTPKAV